MRSKTKCYKFNDIIISIRNLLLHRLCRSRKPRLIKYSFQFSLAHAALLSELKRFLVIDLMNFMCGNKDFQENVEPNIVIKVTATRFIVSNEFGRKFHSVRIIFSSPSSIAINSLPSISLIRTKHGVITIQIQKKFRDLSVFLLFLKPQVGHRSASGSPCLSVAEF